MNNLLGFLNITIGEVVSVEDDNEMGRIKVFCPTLDAQECTPNDLPWCNYATPFGGSISDLVSGPQLKKRIGPKAFGWWSPPKRGTSVIVLSLNSDPNIRYYCLSIFKTHTNRSIFSGRNYLEDEKTPGPFTDTYEEMPYTDGLNSDDNFYRTRGDYERQSGQAKTNKDKSEGYSENINLNDGSLENEVYGFSTPGGHYIHFSDSPDNCRIRIKTASGKQFLLDDTGERIYVATSGHRAYLEMDDSGDVFLYGKNSLNFRSNIINFTSDTSHNIKTKNYNNISINNNTNASTYNITGGSILQTINETYSIECAAFIVGGSSVDIGASGGIVVKGSTFNGQGPAAASPVAAAATTTTTVIPQAEPWERPLNKDVQRNKYWKR